MLDWIRNLRRPRYQPFNRVEILEKNLIENYDYLKSLQLQAEIWPVLKSNAYGHGLKEVCGILNKTDAKMVAVDSYPEAQIVYKNFRGKVLILGELPVVAYKYCQFERTEFCVYNIETLKTLKHTNRKTLVHLFVNTGMNREGTREKELIELIKLIKENEKLELAGLCSHLASADQASELNQKQVENFFKAVDLVRQNGLNPNWLHLGNSAGVFVSGDRFNNGILRFAQDDIKCNAFRVGLAFYGYNPFARDHPKFERAGKLRPALRVMSKVVGVQNLKLGDRVSYNEKFEADKPSRVAVIPFGYFEGLDRRLSNKAEFKIKNKSGEFWAKIAGRVCMNLTCLDCGENEVELGDEVEIISVNPSERNSVQNLADLMGTIAYEVLVKIEKGTRRVVV